MTENKSNLDPEKDSQAELYTLTFAQGLKKDAIEFGVQLSIGVTLSIAAYAINPRWMHDSVIPVAIGANFIAGLITKIGLRAYKNIGNNIDENDDE